MGEPHLWRTANMFRRTCVVVKQMQSNPIQFICRTHMICESDDIHGNTFTYASDYQYRTKDSSLWIYKLT